MNLGEAKPLILSNAVLRILDGATELLVVRAVEKDAGQERARYSVWVIIDGIALDSP